MKRGILLVGFVLLLSACKQEPMIHISPDVQASIDKKAADRQGTATNESSELYCCREHRRIRHVIMAQSTGWNTI